MKPQEIQTEHEVMECPVCHQIIKAIVNILPQLGKPEISRGDGAVTVPVAAVMTKFEIHHRCSGPLEVSAHDEQT